jgi:hypothetical protein
MTRTYPGVQRRAVAPPFEELLRVHGLCVYKESVNDQCVYGQYVRGQFVHKQRVHKQRVHGKSL